jgi:hypothetical protein
VGAALLLGGCGDDGDAQPVEEPDCSTLCEEPKYDLFMACASDEECPDGQRCISRTCQLPPEGYCPYPLELELVELVRRGPGDGVVADVDGDGRMEIVLLEDAQLLLTLFHEPGGEVRTVETQVGFSDTLVVADLDGDGRQDLVARQDQSVVLLQSDGVGGFVETGRLDAFASDLGAGDFDADGNVDLVVCGPEQTRIFFGDGTPTFVPEPVLDLPSGGAVAVGDLDGRPGDDVVHVGELWTAALGAEDTGWTTVVAAQPGPTTFSLPNVGAIDTAAPDEILTVSDEELSIWFGASEDPFADVETHAIPGVGGSSVAVGDVVGDSAADIVVAGRSGIVVLASRDCWIEQPLSASAGPVAVLDFDGDGQDDIATFGERQIAVLFGRRG